MIRSVLDCKTNGELLAKVQPLWFPNYQAETWLDCTWGEGKWWTELEPPALMADLHGGYIDDPHDVKEWDYRRLPWGDGDLDGVFADPPYAPPGGRETSTVKAMHEAYGMSIMPATPKGTFLDHRRLIMEAGRVVKPKGRLVFKCSDFITSGQYWSGLNNAIEAGPLCGWKLEDLVIHESGSGPQPKSRRVICSVCHGLGETVGTTCWSCDGAGKIDKVTDQQHTRRVHSYLVLFVRETWR